MGRSNVIKLDEKGLYETNCRGWVPLLGSELVSVFSQQEVLRLYFKTKDGRYVRVKINFYWGAVQVEEIEVKEK